MTPTTFAQFVQYLQDELAVSKTAIATALQDLGKDSHLLPIALWQYGWLTLTQLDQTYDWLATTYSQPAVTVPEWFDAIMPSAYSVELIKTESVSYEFG